MRLRGLFLALGFAHRCAGLQPPAYYASLQGLAGRAAQLAEARAVLPARDAERAFATFAGGCFWGLELAFQREPGVLETAVGYTGGHAAFPTYGDVCAEATDHAEAVCVAFDESCVTYERLAALFFDRIPDPTMLNRVGSDRGTQYRTALFYHSAAQGEDARGAIAREDAAWRSSGRAVATVAAPAAVFWPAEETHQQFLQKGNGRGEPQSTRKGATEPIRCYG